VTITSKNGTLYQTVVAIEFRTRMVGDEPVAFAVFVCQQDGEPKSIAVDQIARIAT
jgi:hypothetical protein